MKEQFRRVGFKRPSLKLINEFTKDPVWYSKRSWTIAEAKDFQKWVTDYLYDTSEARKELMAFKQKNKKNCRLAAKWIEFQWGWKETI